MKDADIDIKIADISCLQHSDLNSESASSTYTNHDQLYKELIRTFFEEFLEAFFPEVHEYIDFHAVKPISEEVYTDVIEGKTRRLDIVMETKVI